MSKVYMYKIYVINLEKQTPNDIKYKEQMCKKTWIEQKRNKKTKTKQS